MKSSSSMSNRDTLETAVFSMLDANDLDGVRSAIKENSWLLTSTSGFSCTLLHKACWNDQTQMVELLLSLGANINARGGDSDTPLSWSINHIGLETVKVLIRGNADLDAGAPMYWAYARTKSKRDVALELLKAGSRARGDEVFHIAVREGDEQFVEAFLTHGFSANTKDSEGHCLLTWAANMKSDHHHYRIAEKLLAHGANINARNYYGTSPLHWAVCPGFNKGTALAELYLRHGAKLDGEDKQGTTPMMTAAEQGDWAMIHMLVKKAAPAVLAKKNNHGKGLLHFAAANHNEKICKYFISQHFDCNEASKKGWTPLHFACDKHNYKNVWALLEAGAKTDVQNDAGSTPLHFACQNYSTDNVYSLLNAGANTDIQNKKGCTPLHLACKKSKLDLILALLKAGANTDIQNEKGCTPLHLACKKSKFDIILALLKAGARADIKNKKGQLPIDILKDKNGSKEPTDEYKKCIAELESAANRMQAEVSDELEPGNNLRFFQSTPSANASKEALLDADKIHEVRFV